MAKIIFWKIWSALLSAFAIATTPPVFGKENTSEPVKLNSTNSLVLKESEKPVLFLQKNSSASDILFAGHRSHSSHRSHASHASHSAHYSGSSSYESTPSSTGTSSSSVLKNSSSTNSIHNKNNSVSTTPTITTPIDPNEKTQKIEKDATVINYGDNNEQVKILQSLLNLHGYKCHITGNYDSYTKQGVVEFQTKNGLKADGVVESETWKKLKEINN